MPSETIIKQKLAYFGHVMAERSVEIAWKTKLYSEAEDAKVDGERLG